MNFKPADFEDLPIEVVTTESPTGFDSLVENALDFLDRGLKEVKDRPKYSVIHFCAGIELLLKARLLHEHWSLVVARPGETSKQKFKSGDFESVTIRQCFDRLEHVCEQKLSEERACFLELATHRNRVVHFFHDAYAGEANAKLLGIIVIQQLKAGAFLMRLLRHRWKSQFEAHDEAIDKLERSLRRHQQYLKAKFEIVRPRLEKFEADGGEVWECFLCRTIAAQVVENEALVKKTLCLVCESSHTYIRFKCPECNKSDVDFDAGQGTCEVCDTSFDMDFLMSEFEAEGIASCPECSYSETESVIEYGGEYLCVWCGTEFDEVGACDWCGEEVAGDTSDSYLMGCMFCGGLTGHHAND